MQEGTIDYVIKVIVTTLAFIVAASFTALLIGLYSPAVDNKTIFNVIGPLLNGVVGGFLGMLGALKMVELGSSARAARKKKKTGRLRKRVKA